MPAESTAGLSLPHAASTSRPPLALLGLLPSCPHETPEAAGSHSSSECPSFLPGPDQRSQEQPVACTPASPADRPACPTWLQHRESCPGLSGSHHPRCLPGAQPCFQPSLEVGPRPVLTRTHAVSGMHKHASKRMCIHTCTHTPMHPLAAPTPKATKFPILHTAPHRCAPFHTQTAHGNTQPTLGSHPRGT